MKKDLFVMLIFFLLGLGYLFYHIKEIHHYPYFIVATFIFFTSLGLFFIFLQSLTKIWFQRMIIVNIGVVLFIPIVEGTEWIPFTILYSILLAFVFIGYTIFLQKKEKDHC